MFALVPLELSQEALKANIRTLSDSAPMYYLFMSVYIYVEVNALANAENEWIFFPF